MNWLTTFLTNLFLHLRKNQRPIRKVVEEVQSAQFLENINCDFELEDVIGPEIYSNGVSLEMFFMTRDEKFGRVIFDHVDSYKVYRGEGVLYDKRMTAYTNYPWIYRLINSEWQFQRYLDEKTMYEFCYEFGGNVSEMLTDMNNYVFEFHDETVEVIAKGFWIETSPKPLWRKPLQKDNPLNPNFIGKIDEFEIEGILCRMVTNKAPTECLIEQTKFCHQTLAIFEVEFEGNFSRHLSLVIFQRSNQLYSELKPIIGKPLIGQLGTIDIDTAVQEFEKAVIEISARRKNRIN